jgi:DNA-binding transcriptional regulator YiaG
MAAMAKPDKIDIRELRARLGAPEKPISQADLGQRMGGVGQWTVSRWETGEFEPEGPALILLHQLWASTEPASDAREQGSEYPQPLTGTGP